MSNFSYVLIKYSKLINGICRSWQQLQHILSVIKHSAVTAASLRDGCRKFHELQNSLSKGLPLSACTCSLASDWNVVLKIWLKFVVCVFFFPELFHLHDFPCRLVCACRAGASPAGGEISVWNSRNSSSVADLVLEELWLYLDDVKSLNSCFSEPPQRLIMVLAALEWPDPGITLVQHFQLHLKLLGSVHLQDFCGDPDLQALGNAKPI